MSFRIAGEWLYQGSMSPRAKLALLCLAEHAREDDGMAWPSMMTVARGIFGPVDEPPPGDVERQRAYVRECRRREQAARRAIGELLELGAIEHWGAWHPRKRPRPGKQAMGSGWTNAYRIRSPETLHGRGVSGDGSPSPSSQPTAGRPVSAPQEAADARGASGGRDEASPASAADTRAPVDTPAETLHGRGVPGPESLHRCGVKPHAKPFTGEAGNPTPVKGEPNYRTNNPPAPARASAPVAPVDGSPDEGGSRDPVETTLDLIAGEVPPDVGSLGKGRVVADLRGLVAGLLQAGWRPSELATHASRAGWRQVANPAAAALARLQPLRDVEAPEVAHARRVAAEEHARRRAEDERRRAEEQTARLEAALDELDDDERERLHDEARRRLEASGTPGPFPPDRPMVRATMRALLLAAQLGCDLDDLTARDTDPAEELMHR